MKREMIIQKTIKTLRLLPEEKAEEVSQFADFILKNYEEYCLQQGIQKTNSDSGTFHFLNEDENLYSPSDIKEKF